MFAVGAYHSDVTMQPSFYDPYLNFLCIVEKIIS